MFIKESAIEKLYIDNLVIEEAEIATEFLTAVITESEDGKPKIEIKHPGAFTTWCKQQGFDEVNCECICKAMETNNPTLHKRANFAYNFAFKRNGKTCDCVEKRKGK